MDSAHKAATEIVKDLDDRAGFSLVGVDDDTKRDMVETWAAIIRVTLPGKDGDHA